MARSCLLPRRCTGAVGVMNEIAGLSKLNARPRAGQRTGVGGRRNDCTGTLQLSACKGVAPRHRQGRRTAPYRDEHHKTTWHSGTRGSTLLHSGGTWGRARRCCVSWRFCAAGRRRADRRLFTYATDGKSWQRPTPLKGLQTPGEQRGSCIDCWTGARTMGKRWRSLLRWENGRDHRSCDRALMRVCSKADLSPL